MTDALPPDSAAFRAAMRHFVGNVTVITVGAGTERSGLVVTTGISLSADPPLFLACINRNSSSWPLLARFGAFGANSLAAHQQEVADRFSGAAGVHGAARYAGAEWHSAVTGAPLLGGAAVRLDCTVEEMIDRATHSILIGRVRAIETTPGAGALIYWDGAYRSLAG